MKLLARLSVTLVLIWIWQVPLIVRADNAPPDPMAIGPTLATAVVGTYHAPPRQIGSQRLGDGAVLGNGDLGVMAGGPPEKLSFYFGKADFWSILKGGVAPAGSLNLEIPGLASASYLVQQNVGPATLTGFFGTGDGAGLAMKSWVCAGTNLFVLQLENKGSKPLSISSTLRDGLGTPGNKATVGAESGTTWMRISPDLLNLELGNRLLGREKPPESSKPPESPFKGEIADFRIYDSALDDTARQDLEASSHLRPFYAWTATTPGQLKGTAHLELSELHGGALVLDGTQDGELWAGAMRIPQKAFTLSVWIKASEVIAGRSCLASACLNPGDKRAHGICLSLVDGKANMMLNRVSISSPNVLPLNEWVQLCATYDGATLSLFVDGKNVGTSQAFPTAEAVMGADQFACHFGDSKIPWNGCGPDALMVQRLAEGESSVSDNILHFTILPGAHVTLLVSAVTDRNHADFEAEARRLVQAGLPQIVEMERAHADWWQRFWSKSYVQLGDQTIQDSWYASLYLLACCSKGDCPPPGLWGNFVTSPNPYWNGDYTLNYNYEAPFWAAYMTNHLELADNYEAPLIDYMSRGRAIAQSQKTPQKGIMYYVHLIPAPGWSNDGAQFLNQKSGALFAAVDCVMRWKFTPDLDYAKKVYPFLLATADFWDNYLVLRDGHYVDLDDAAGENKQNDNPATSLAFLRLLYPTLIEMSRQLNLNPDRIARWKDILDRLSPLPIVPAATIDQLETSLNPLAPPPPKGQRKTNDFTVTLEKLLGPEVVKGRMVIRNGETGWGFPYPMVNVYHDRHQRQSGPGMSSSQCLFPGWAIGLESGDLERKAALDTVTLTAHWYDFNNMCTFYADAACAGYDPNEILENLHELLVRTAYPNFIVPEGGGGTEAFAIVPDSLASMFLQSYQKNIHLFPDWPADKDASFGNLNACGGFLVSSRIRQSVVAYVKIESLAGQECRMVNPWPGKEVRFLSTSSKPGILSGAVLQFSTMKGEKVTLTPGQ